MCIDGNSAIGSHTSDHIGGWWAREENENGQALHHLLASQSLYVPCTFEGIGQDEDDFTWTHSQGSTHRNDYIAVPLRWKCCLQRAWVSEVLELGIKADDHRASILEICIDERGREELKLPEPPKYSRQLVKTDLAAQEAFRRSLSELKCQPWCLEAASHLAILSEQVRHLLEWHFPIPRRKKRESWIPAEVWGQMDERAGCWKAARLVKKKVELAPARRAIGIWRRRADECNRHPHSRVGITSRNESLLAFENVQLALIQVSIDSLTTNISRGVKRDKAAHVQGIHEQVRQARTAGDSNQVYKGIKRLMPFKGWIAPPIVMLEDGTPATSPAEHDARWLRHFSEAMMGIPLERHELVQQARLRQQNTLYVVPASELHIKYTPSVLDTSLRMRKAKSGKAFGPDQICGEVRKYFSTELAAHFGAVENKSCLRLEEPIQWKGSHLRELYKGKGPVTLCPSYRDISLADDAGKCFQRGIRAHLEDDLRSFSRPTQCGGIDGRGVDFGVHAVQAFVAWAEVSSDSSGLLFVDAIAAFSSVIRGLVLDIGAELCEVHLVSLVSVMDLPPEAYQELRAQMASPAMREAGAHPPISVIAAETHKGTWSSVGRTRATFESQKGSRARVPLGDFVYNFLMAKVMGHLHRRARALGLTTEANWTGQHIPWQHDTPRLCFVDLLDLSYVDDVVFFLTCLLYTSPSPRDGLLSRMPSSA